MVQRISVDIPSVLSATIDVVSKVGSMTHLARMGTVNRVSDVRQTDRPDYLLNLPAGTDLNSVMRTFRVDTIGRTNITGSVNIKGQPIQVKQTSPLNMYVLGNAISPGMSVIYNRCDATGNLYVVSGSIGLRGGSVGIKNGSIGVNSIPSISGTVDIRTGSVGVSHLPPVTGSIDVRTGSIVIKSLPSISGTVDIRTGSVGISHLPSISGTVDIRTGSVGISHLPPVTGSVGISHLPSISGTVDSVRTASGTCGLVSIAGSPELLLDGNSSRLGAFVQNIGSTAGTGSVYIGFDHTVTATKMGARLKDSDSYSTTIYIGSIWGKGTGSIDVAVHEY